MAIRGSKRGYRVHLLVGQSRLRPMTCIASMLRGLRNNAAGEVFRSDAMGLMRLQIRVRVSLTAILQRKEHHNRV